MIDISETGVVVLHVQLASSHRPVGLCHRLLIYALGFLLLFRILQFTFLPGHNYAFVPKIILPRADFRKELKQITLVIS